LDRECLDAMPSTTCDVQESRPGVNIRHAAPDLSMRNTEQQVVPRPNAPVPSREEKKNIRRLGYAERVGLMMSESHFRHSQIGLASGRSDNSIIGCGSVHMPLKPRTF
jgi:hypothetical protein